MKKIFLLIIAIALIGMTGCSISSFSSHDRIDYPSFGMEGIVEQSQYPIYTGNNKSECIQLNNSDDRLQISTTYYRDHFYKEDMENPFLITDLWCPYIDNNISINDAYGKQVVSNEKAWISYGRVVYASPYHLYLFYEPETTFVRKIDDSHIYAVYNAEGGGRVFVFFEGRPYAFDENKQEYIMTLSLYVTDTLQKSDFDTILIGNTIDDVVAIDRSAEYIKKNGLTIDMKYSYHLLTDGLMTIKYREENGNLIVDEILFSDEYVSDIRELYELSEDVAKQYDETNKLLRNVKILPQDYPQG